jgi:hypothetical protein
MVVRMAAPVVLELAAMPEVRVGHFGSLMVMVWRGTVTPESLDKTNEVEDALIKQHGRISVIGIITDMGGGVPSAELRQKSAQAMKRFEPHVRGTALVVVAEGAKAVLFRTFLAGFTLLIDFPSPLKIFKSLADGVTWLQRMNGQDEKLAEPELAQAVTEFVTQSRPASRPAASAAR